jgi:hypothetical protein
MVANPVPLAEVEKLFLAWLPEIQSRAWAINHRLRPDERQECVAEVTAWCWAWMIAGARKSRLEKMTPRTMCIFGSKMFASGRRFAAGCSVHDVMSESAKSSGKVAVCSLNANHGDDPDSPHTMGSILADTRRPRPYDETRISLDYRTALKRPGLPRKGRRVFGLLVRDHSDGHGLRIAQAMKISPARVCQLKTCLATALTEIGYGPTLQPQKA